MCPVIYYCLSGAVTPTICPVNTVSSKGSNCVTNYTPSLVYYSNLKASDFYVAMIFIGRKQLWVHKSQLFFLIKETRNFPSAQGIHSRVVALSFFNASSSGFCKFRRLGRPEQSFGCRRDRYWIMSLPLVCGVFPLPLVCCAFFH